MAYFRHSPEEMELARETGFSFERIRDDTPEKTIPDQFNEFFVGGARYRAANRMTSLRQIAATTKQLPWSLLSTWVNTDRQGRTAQLNYRRALIRAARRMGIQLVGTTSAPMVEVPAPPAPTQTVRRQRAVMPAPLTRQKAEVRRRPNIMAILRARAKKNIPVTVAEITTWARKARPGNRLAQRNYAHALARAARNLGLRIVSGSSSSGVAGQMRRQRKRVSTGRPNRVAQIRYWASMKWPLSIRTIKAWVEVDRGSLSRPKQQQYARALIRAAQALKVQIVN